MHNNPRQVPLNLSQESGTSTAGQPGLRQGTQGKMSVPTQAGTAKLSPDPKKCRLIQQHLVLLLHANMCQQRENQANGEMQQCTLPDCKFMKNILNHLRSCQAGKNCTVPLGSLSRKVICHWKHCNRSKCPVCSQIKQAKRRRTNLIQAFDIQPINQPHPSLSEMRMDCDTLKIQCPTTTPGLLPGQDVGVPVPGIAGPSGTLGNVNLPEQPQIPNEYDILLRNFVGCLKSFIM
ncbi:CREB-binding protein [Anoplolepis gracilipes]|uniref:CREB-binding protein n=1 Tax=Anoplolepis gracilipes TaxID=354296 RepID=UPI003BA28E70